MQEVQTCILRVVPPPAGVRTVWMFGFQRRLVRRCEWDTLWPKPGRLPQTSHTLATGCSRGSESSSRTGHEQPVKVTRHLRSRPNHPWAVGLQAVLESLDDTAVRRW